MNIRIVICFIIFFFLPLAAAGAADNVWAVRSSAFLKSNTSLSFEDYIIKARVLDDSKASVTIQRGGTLIETGEFYINDFKKYDSTGITLLGIKGDYSWVSVSKLENRDVWQQIAKTRLTWGESYTIEDHTVEIDTVGTDSVNLIISNKSTSAKELFVKDGFRDYDTLRLVVTDISRTGAVELEFFTNKVPQMKAEIITDKDEYFPDETIHVTVNATGEAVQNVLGITLEASKQARIEPALFTAEGAKDTTFHSNISELPENSTLTLTAKIEVRDFYNRAYTVTASKDILVTPVVAIIKRVQADTDDENVPVQLYVYNFAREQKSVRILDSIPEDLNSQALDWNIELGPGNSTVLEYNITLKKPGLYILPAARAEWDGGSAVSRKVKITMHMPYLNMTKTAVLNDSQTQVKLVALNTGDRPAQVRITDKIPDGVRVSGDTAWSGKLESGESTTISYSLQGEVSTLPAADATYRDIRGVMRTAQSNVVDNKGSHEEKDDTIPLNVLPNEMIIFMTLSFLATAGIIISAAAIAYAITRIRR
ncbi:MAG: hypothetical protein OIN88_01540 [Candidatus Methanoperedens sp.]|nr:hypothetical protein [Candidatus Methanoperedens sp.]